MVLSHLSSLKHWEMLPSEMKLDTPCHVIQHLEISCQYHDRKNFLKHLDKILSILDVRFYFRTVLSMPDVLYYATKQMYK